MPGIGEEAERVVVVVMGVSGSGKSTVGRLLAERLGVPFADADDLHPPANIAKMSAGVPLDDTDRLPWLRAIAQWIADRSGGAVIGCSALKRVYRDVLRESGVPLWFLHLSGDQRLIADRVAARPDHFMPAALVDSQYHDLEPLCADEAGLVVDTAPEPAAIAGLAAAVLTKHEGVLA